MIKALAPIFFLVAAVSLFFLYVDPTYGEVEELQSEAEAYDEALRKAQVLQSRKNTLLSKYNSFPGPDIDRLEKLLPDAVDNVRLTLDLDGIARRYNMRVEAIEIENREPPKGVVAANTAPYETVLMSFAVRGTYEDLLGFLSDLEKSLRIVDVVELSFDARTEDVYEYQVTIQTYWLR